MRSLLTTALALALISSCSLPEEAKEEPAKSETRPRLVGRIASVPAGGGFVLIESYGPWRVSEGGLLSGVGGDGRSSSLVVTGEKLGRHAAADIRSGEVKVGDPVYYRPLKEESGPENGTGDPDSGPAGAGLEAVDSQKDDALMPANR
jgi:hypothetical protein